MGISTVGLFIIDGNEWRWYENAQQKYKSDEVHSDDIVGLPVKVRKKYMTHYVQRMAKKNLLLCLCAVEPLRC
jgi:hypothetical protein